MRRPRAELLGFDPLPRPGPRAQLSYLRRLFGSPHRVLDEIYEAHGPVVKLGVGAATLAIVADPAAIGDLFAESPDSFRWDHRLNLLGIWVGRRSMITSDGAEHRRRRGAVQEGFARRRLNGWIPMILRRTDAAIDGVVASSPSPTQPVDLYPVGRALVLDVVVRALCGPRLATRAPEIGILLERTQDYFEGPALKQVPHPLPLGRRHRARRDRRAFDAILDEEIARIRSAPDGDEFNVLESLVEAGDLSDAEIRDQVATLFGAAYDTTSAALAWLLLRAAATPDLWDRLASEADAVLGDGDVPDHADLTALDLARRTVSESLRLHPPGPFGVREAAVDVAAGGYRVPRGTLVVWSMHLAGRDPHHWSDPLSFDPGRHLDPSPEQDARAKAAWVPFGGGARNCIGFALAQIELTLIVARFAQRLALEPAEAEVPPTTRRSRPATGARFTVTPR